MNWTRQQCLTLLISFSFIASGCSSGPKISEEPWDLNEATRWLKLYCSPVPMQTEISGSVVIRAQTEEFKGQMPGSIRVWNTGDFVLEATHMLG